MGRYDKIRCWNGSSWVQPKQMYVWNGSSWVDFGANDSSNTRSMYTWNGSSWVRKTLNKQTNVVAQDHYLLYQGNSGINFNFDYQFYGATYEFIVEPSGTGNYMLYEIARTTSDPGYYARFGFYLSGSTYYLYGKSCYNSSAREVNTMSKGSLAAGVKYTAKYYCSGQTQYLSVYNHSSGTTWTVSGGASRFNLNNLSGGSRMFNGYSVSGRNLYGKVYYAYIYGTYYNGPYSTSQYYLNNTPGGSATLIASAGSNVAHNGTVVDPSYTTVSWV